MMIRQKFKAWDNVENKMYSVGAENDIYFYLDSEGIRAERIPENGIIQDESDVDKLEHLIYLQYTGLKDKNGVEIYDGDVLEWDKAEWGDEHFETVLWDYNLFSLRERDWPQFCEVIGNVHEDKETTK